MNYQNLKKSIILAILIGLLPCFLQAGYYFRDDFNTLDTTIWYPDFFMAREGRINLNNATYQAIISAGGTLDMLDIIYSANSYDGAWGGTGVIMSNQKFSVTEENPIGAEIRIVSWQILNNGPSPAVEMADFGLWIAEDRLSSVTDYTEEYQNFQTKVMFYYTAKNGTTPDNFWGAFVNGSDFKLDLENAVRPDGSTVDINSLNGLTINVTGNELVTTNISIKMVINGADIYMYINPDPNNINAFPNEFCLVGNFSASFSDNIRFYLNEEVRNKNSYCNPRFDYFLIRSSVDTTTPGMITGSVVNPSTNAADRKDFNMQIANTVSGNNAGINIITITKPSEFGNWSAINLTNEISVFSAYDGGATLLSNTVLSIAQQSTLAANECSIETNGNQLWIRFGKQIDNTCLNQNIQVKFKMLSASNEGFYTFTSTVEAVLFDPPINNQTNYSTCGPQKQYTSVEVDSTIYGPADGFASIVPNEIIQGNNEYSFTFYVQSTTNLFTYDIAQVAIMIPDNFIIKTNSIDSFKLDSDLTYISIQEIPALAGSGTNFILIDYGTALAKLSAGGEMDILTFNTYGQCSKGNWHWKTWVDENAISASSLQAKTNSVFISQHVNVLGAPPNVSIGITYPPDDVVPEKIIFFNTTTINTLEFTIQNLESSEPDNRIQVAVIDIPGIFTNISILNDDKLVPGPNMKLVQGTGGNNSVITLFYGNGGNPINYNFDSDTITLRLIHNITNNQITNVYFSAVVNNSNGQGYLQPVVSLVTDVLVTDPQPFGKAYIEVNDGIIYTSDITNNFTYRIYNVASSGDILYARIAVPTNYFSFTTNIISSRSNASISKNGVDIILDYSVNPIPPGELDVITFALTDKYTNYAVPAAAYLTSEVMNNTKTNATTDYNPDLAFNLTMEINFIPQEARVQSYVSNNNILTAATTSTLYYIFKNNGDPGNRVKDAQATFTGIGGGGVISSISKATSANGGLWNIAGLTFSKNNYYLPAGQTDIIKIIIDDTIISETTRDLVPLVTVNTSTLVPTSLPSSKVNVVVFQTPPPDADGQLHPVEMFTSTVPVTNYFTLTIFNDGEGSNELEKAIIYIPALLNGKVKALSNSWMPNTNNIINQPGSITIHYSNYGDTLDANTFDYVYLQVVNDITVQSNVDFVLKVLNNDGKGEYDTGLLAGGTKTLSIIGQPDGFVKTPKTIESASTTNQLTYRIKNSDDGKAVIRARISIPIGFTVTNISGSWPSVVYMISNNYIYCDYNVNDLDAGGYDEIEFTIIDSYAKTNGTFAWPTDIQYDVNDIFYIAGTNGGQDLSINFTRANANAYLDPTQVLLSINSNNFTYVITNKGTGSNSIYEAYIYFNTTFLNVSSELSSKITNDALNVIVNDGLGYIWLRYDEEGGLLAGEKDTVTFAFIDTVESETNYTISCSVNNGLGLTNTTTIGGSKQLDFIPARVDSYITPNVIQTTTETNTFTYRVNNAGDLNPYYKIIIHVPPVFNNIVSVNSDVLGATGISGNISSITMNYTNTASLGTGENDVITIIAADNLSSGFTNVSWTADASNVLGWTNGIKITGGQSQKVAFIMPAPDVKVWATPDEIYTTSVSNRITYKVYNAGNGSNNLYDIVIYIPAAFSNISKVTSSHLASQANIYPAGLGNITAITLDYAGDGNGLLQTGTTDTIIITAYDKTVTRSSTNIWSSVVRNISGGTQFSTTEAAGKSITSEFVNPPLVEINPNVVETTKLSNIFVYTINNAGAGGSKPLQSARIYYDSAIFTNIRISGSYATTISTNAAPAYIQLDYGSGLLFGTKDDITIKAFDSITVGNINTTWPALVDKGDGYKPSHLQGSTNVSIQMPSAVGKSSMKPNLLSTLIVSNNYTCDIINDGTDYNDIKIVKISVPLTITNINAISSVLSVDTVVNGNVVWVYYTNGGSFVTGATDRIQIYGYDSILTNISETWDIQVANTPDTNDLVQTTIIPGNSKVIDYSKPSLEANSEINPLQISAFELTNAFTINVTNKGNLYNYLFTTRITVPGFITNISSLNSSIMGPEDGTVVKVSNNYIIVDYQETNFNAGVVDIISFVAWDSITSFTSGTWVVEVDNYNGEGFSNINNFNLDVIIPPPDAKAGIQPNIVFADISNNIYYCKIANYGLKNNSIKNAIIQFPPNVTVTSATSSQLLSGANLDINTSSITLHYETDGTSLTTSVTDNIIIYCSDTIADENGDFSAIFLVDNGTGTYTNISAFPTGSLLVDIVDRPSGSINPAVLESETFTNTLTYRIFNEGFNGKEIKVARIWIPTEFTSDLAIITNSLNTDQLIDLANAYISNQWLVLNYENDALGDLKNAELETLTFDAVDTVTKASANTTWTLQINYLDGYGWKRTQNYGGGDQNLAINLTPARGSAISLYDKYYYTATNNNFIIIFTNKGYGSNYLEKLRLTLVDANYNFASLNVTSSFLTDDVNNITNTQSAPDLFIDLYYNNEGNMPANTVETLSITLADTIVGTLADNITVEIDNGDGNGYVPATAGNNLPINYVAPGEAEITPTQVYSTTSGKIVFTYSFRNSSAYPVEKLFIPLPTFMTSIQVDSDHIVNDGANIIINSTGMTLNYNADAGGDLPVIGLDTIYITNIDSFNYGTTNFTFQSYMTTANMPYVSTIIPVSKTKTVNYVMPNAIGDSSVKPNQLSTLIVTNTYTCKIRNNGYDLNNILMAKITIPATITNISTIASILSFDTVLNGNILWIYYTNSPFVTSASDQIQILASDDILLNTSENWSILIANTLDTNNFFGTAIIPGDSKIISYTKPPLSAAADTTPLQISAFEFTNTFNISITNKGNPFNFLLTTKIAIPGFITNLTALNSSHVGPAGANLKVTNIGPTNYILVNYNGTNFDANEVDTVSFIAWDNVTTSTSGIWSVQVDNGSGAGLTNIGVFNLNVVVPPPDAEGDITPNLIFTDITNQTYDCKIVNYGIGNNTIKNAVIAFPAGITVTSATSTRLLSQANLITGASSITLHYQTDGTSLTTGITDFISIQVVDTLLSENDDFSAIFSVDNGTGFFTPISAIPSGSLSVNLIERPSGSITPSVIESETSTNSFTYEIKNEGANGSDIKLARIWIPNQFTSDLTIISNTLTTVQLQNLASAFISNQWLVLHYDIDPGDMAKAELETLTFDAVDNIAKASATTSWTLEINHLDGYGWKKTKNYGGGDQMVNINFTPAKGSASLVYNKYYYTATNNNFIIVFTNKGYGSNYLEKIQITLNSTNYNYSSLNVTSSYIANDAADIITTNSGGNITITAIYTNDGNLSANTVETLYMAVKDNVTNSYIDNVTVEIDNGDGNGFVPATSGNILAINYEAPGEAFVNPTSVLSTTSGDIDFTYSFRNSSTYEVEQLFIPLPSFITSVNVTSTWLNNNTNISWITNGTTNGILVDYSSDPNGNLQLNTLDEITITSIDSFNFGYTNYTFLSFMKTPFMPYVYTIIPFGKTKKANYIMPSAEGESSVKPNMLSTLDVTNTYTCRVINTGADLNNILIVQITVPATITNISTITSTLSTDVVQSNNIIRVYYTNGGTFVTGATDEIRIHGSDNILLNTSETWDIQIANTLSNYFATAIIQGDSKTIDFQKPPLNATASVIPTQISAYEVTNTFNLFITNIGGNFNYIFSSKISIPGFITNLTALNSSHAGPVGANVKTTNIGVINYILINYDPTNFNNNETETISFIAWDNATGFTSGNWNIQLDNGSGAGYSNVASLNLDVYIPPPDAEADIKPNIVFAESTNHTFNCQIVNYGIGNNTIKNAVVEFPAGVIIQGATSTRLSSSAFIITNLTTITLQYQADGSSLTTGITDNITIYWSNTITNDAADFDAIFKVDNGTGIYSNISAMGSGSLFVDMVFRPIGSILPTSIESETSTNTYSYNIKNEGADPDGADVKVVRIGIPNEFTNNYQIITNTLASSGQLQDPTNNAYISNQWLVLNFNNDTGDLRNAELETITFDAIDNITKASSVVTWPLEINYMDGFGWKSTGNYGGDTQDLTIDFTVAKGSASLLYDKYFYTGITNLFTLVFTNKGIESNYLKKMRITFNNANYNYSSLNVLSSFLTDDVNNISNSQSGPNIYIEADYAAESNLPANTVETLFITLADNITGIASDSITVEIDNGDGKGYVPATSGNTINIDYAAPGEANIVETEGTLDNKVETTISTNIVFSYPFRNSTTYEVERLFIPLPSFITSFNATSTWITNNSNIVILTNGGTNAIRIDYVNDANGNLPLTRLDDIKITTKDNFLFGYTNNTFESYMQSPNMPYVSTIIPLAKTKIIHYLMPDAKAQSYIQSFPSTLFTTTVPRTNQMKYIIQNLGKGSDEILKVRINIPAGFTVLSNLPGNTNMISSTIVNDFGRIILSNNYIVLDYSNSPISAQTFETVTFNAVYNINFESFYAWPSDVDNRYIASNYQSVSVWPTKSQQIDVKDSGTGASSYITPNANVYSTRTNALTFTMYIENKGISGNDIEMAQIVIPTNAFTTNNINIASSQLTYDNLNIYLSNNFIILDYVSDTNVLTPGQIDIITLSIFNRTNQNTPQTQTVNWIVKTKFNTTGVYEIATEAAGQSLNVSLTMPPASANAYVETFKGLDYIYTPVQYSTLKYYIINTGGNTGNNHITKARIFVPPQFQNNFTNTNISSSYITNESHISYANGVITLDYFSVNSNKLTTGSTDILTLRVEDAIGTSTLNIPWISEINNYEVGTNGYTNTTIPAGKQQDIDIKNPTSQSKAYITPDTINSTDITNHFSYYIDNSGSDPADLIYLAKIQIPSAVSTNDIYNIQSTIISTNFTNNIYFSNINGTNFIILDYVGAGQYITNQKNDIITFVAQDNISSGATNLSWNSFVNFSNTLGYFPTAISSGSAKDVDLIHPAVEALAYILPPSSINIAYSNTNTRVFQYKITNMGVGNNKLFYAQIEFPGVLVLSNYGTLANLQMNLKMDSTVISNDATNLIIYSNNNQIIVQILYYTNQNHLLAGQSDLITFTLTNFRFEVEDYVTFRCRAINSNTAGLPPTAPLTWIDVPGSILEIQDQSPWKADAYLEKDSQILYTLDNYAELKFVIRNESDLLDIGRAYINFTLITNSNVRIREITSEKLPLSEISVFTSAKSSNIVLNYSNFKIAKKRDFDTITIKLDYQIQTPVTNQLKCYAHFFGTDGTFSGNKSKLEKADEGTETQNLQIIDAIWGKIIGIMTPNDEISVSLYRINETSYATNYDGDKIFISRIRLNPTNTSGLVINKVPPGTYDIECTKLGYKTERYKINIDVKQNKVTNIGQIDLIPVWADAYLDRDENVIYTLDYSAEIKYRIDNRSPVDNISKAEIHFDTSLFSNLQISSKLIGNNLITTSDTNIVLNYANNVFIPSTPDTIPYDEITIKFDYNLDTPQIWELSCNIDTTLTNYKAATGIGTNKLHLQYAYWGLITGTIKPNEEITLNVYNNATSSQANNLDSKFDFISIKNDTTNVADFTMDKIRPGNYHIKVKSGSEIKINDIPIDIDYTIKYKDDITVISNSTIDVGTIVLLNKKLIASNAQTIRCFDDPQFRLDFDKGSTEEDLFIDVYKIPVATSPEYEDAVSANGTIIDVAKSDQLMMYHIDLRNVTNADLTENEIEVKIGLTLHYDDEELTAQGWNGDEDDLAIYYLKRIETSKGTNYEWVRLGGKVDPDNNTISISVNYLHTHYAVFKSTAPEYIKIFGDLKCWPNPFTPLRGGDVFANLKISFIFQQGKEPNEFYFKVYDLIGREIYTKDYTGGPFYQGEIYWDGKDNDDYVVKTGVYIYQIETGNEYYRGKVLILR